jgi:two-component system, NtrC family, nitrogen regulation sensor histidine kinase NtrY
VECRKTSICQSLKYFLEQHFRKNAIFLLSAGWLFTLAFVINNYWFSSSSVKYIHKHIQQDVQIQAADFASIVADTNTVKRLNTTAVTEEVLKYYLQKPYCLLLYYYDTLAANTLDLKFWSNQMAVPNNMLLLSKDSAGFITMQNGQYVFCKKLIHTARHQILALALIPIRKQYFVENKNLKKEFVNYPQAEKNIIITRDSTDYPIKNNSHKTLFYLQQKFINTTASSNWATLLLNILGVLLLLIVVHNTAHAIAEKKGYLKGIFFLIGSVVGIRSLTYYFPQLLAVQSYGLFDPSIYSSNSLLNSLGDLMINTFLFCWMVLFVRKEVGQQQLLLNQKKLWKWPIILCALSILMVVTFAFANIIKSLIADAKISFNVTNFFTLDIYSLVGFVILATLALSFFFLSQVILQLLSPIIPNKPYQFFLLMAILGLFMISVLKPTSIVPFNICVLLWLLAYVWFLQHQSKAAKFFKLTVSEVLLWLFIFSSSMAAIIVVENQQIEFEQRKRTAEKLSNQADPSSEKLISIALKYFDNDFLSPNFYRLKEAYSNAQLKDSLINTNFSPYLSKYDTRIYTFIDSADSPKPLFNEGPVSFDTLNTVWRMAKETNVPDLHYFEKSFDKYAYIYRKSITDNGMQQGYLFVISEPKRYKNDALIPELFRYQKEFFPEYALNYTYAIYNEGRLIDYSNEYPFALKLPKQLIPHAETEIRKNEGYEEFWYKENNKVVVIARKDNYVLEIITLFAYIFSTFLVLLSLFRLMSIFIQTRFKRRLLKQELQLNLRGQIHGTFIGVTLLSFVIIGIATIFFFVNRYERNNISRLSKAIQIMNNQVQTEIGRSSTFNEMVKQYETGPNVDLEKMAQRVSEIHGTDINFYDLTGRLVVSSNPFIYNKGILSDKMNPLAYYQLHQKGLVQFINEEQMGNVKYQSIYSPVRDASGNAYAYLNIPSFDAQEDLKKEISNFLVTIINLNAFIFLIAGVVALFITNRITSSFTLIAEKMQAINLGKDNEEIPWNREDEIGGLVKEYNKMVNKLEDSAAQLAKSEREGAWREMARQVAHEIKNPLTPMKLSIQYLQKAINNNNPNVKEMTKNVADTLVEQIDHLAKIAADFSQFANIGNPKNEWVDIHEVLQSLATLYDATDKLQFTWKQVQQKILVWADKTQLNRLFTNLLQNAVEACNDTYVREVSIHERLNGQNIIIQITDNGEGIPKDVQERIFTPNFTTKTSGTGLGLAMSRSIVEQAKGKLWFETQEGMGSSFFVQLPLVKL